MIGIPTHDRLFNGVGEMRHRCRNYDWSKSALGMSERWPQSLRTVVALTLATPEPTVLLWGPNLTQIYNDAYARLMGSKHPAGLAQSTRECWPEVWSINEPIYQRVSNGESVWITDALYPVNRRHGIEDAWFSLTYVPVTDEDQDIAGILVTVVERTQTLRAGAERARAMSLLDAERAQLKEVFRKAPSFMAIFDCNMRYEFVNDAHALLVGDRPVEGLSLLEAMPELEGQGFVELLEHVRDTGDTWVGRELSVVLNRIHNKPGEIRFVDLTYYSLSGPDGTCAGVVAHGSDVTDRVFDRLSVAKLLEESEEGRLEAETARAQAEAANLSKGRFLAVMSHELRTPLNAIGGYAELIQLGIRGPVTDEQLNDLGRIQSSKSHLLGLINEVLDFAKLETGTLEYEQFPVRLCDALSGATALIAPQARAKNLTLLLDDCPPEITAMADRDKIRQVLVNMLSNAVKFTPGGGSIRITCEQAEKGVVRLVLIDSGIGIPADQLEKIFRPFEQVSTDYGRRVEGTGLGLSISRDLARGMGGDLTVQSLIGQGAQFTLSLPSA